LVLCKQQGHFILNWNYKKLLTGKKSFDNEKMKVIKTLILTREVLGVEIRAGSLVKILPVTRIESD
jgi:hypothetical protein